MYCSMVVVFQESQDMYGISRFHTPIACSEERIFVLRGFYTFLLYLEGRGGGEGYLSTNEKAFGVRYYSCRGIGGAVVVFSCSGSVYPFSES